MQLTRLQDGMLRSYGDLFLTKCSRKHKSCYFKYSKVIRVFLDNGMIEVICPKCGDDKLRNGWISNVVRTTT